MPEGDTVWLTGRRLHDALAGDPLTVTDFRVPQLATVDLRGRGVVEVVTRGKHLLTRIDDDLTLHTHLRMDGSWHVYGAQERRRGPEWQVRVLLATERRQAVGYRLPVVELLPRDREADVVGHLGPDILGPDWDADEAVRRLALAPDRELGLALLDQRNLAGVGNLYQCEVCFLAGVTPWTPVRDVPDLARVVDRVARLLQSNKETAAQVTTGDSRRGREHWVYDRAGRPCRRCGTTVLAAGIGQPPRSRIAAWCPRCQRGPAPARPMTTPRTPIARPHPR
jgi:endonuclease-8